MVALLLLVERMHFPAATSNAAAFLAANLWSFLLNAAFTFRVRPSVRSYARFFVVSLSGFGVNFLVVWAGVQCGVHYLFCALVSIAVVTLIGYVGSKRYAFRNLT